MNIEDFRGAFWRRFGAARNRPLEDLISGTQAAMLDLCPGVEGMLSLRKQYLLNLAFGLLPEGEAYLEIGTYRGKSLVSALRNNPRRPVFACDNFSEFDTNNLATTRATLERFGLADWVTFYDCDFREIFTPKHLPIPLGMYFYDGAHDDISQFEAIQRVEPFLADEALVLVDDWRFAPDSRSYARAATLRAAGESTHEWRLLYELPARYNGDLGLWWNGVGILSFKRCGVIEGAAA